MLGSKTIFAAGLGFAFLIGSFLIGAPNSALAAAAQGEWSNIPPSLIARSEVQTAVIDGKIYVVGGNTFEMRNGGSVVVNDVGLNEVYDPATNEWTTLAPVPRGANHTAIAALDGKIYIAGGFTERRHGNTVDWFYAYDSAQDVWQALP